MKFIGIKCLLLIFMIMSCNYCEAVRVMRSHRNRMKLKLKRVDSILKDMNSIKKFTSFFNGFIKTGFLKLLKQEEGSLTESVKVVLSQIQGSCTSQSFAFYQNFIKEETNKSGKRKEILDEVYGNDNQGIELRQETRKRCETLENALKDGSLKKEGFFEKVGNGLLSMISIIPMPSFMKNMGLKIDESTKSYLEKNVEFIEGTLSKDNLKYLKSIKNKDKFKKDAAEFIDTSIEALDSIFIGKKNICEIWSNFSDVSTTLFIEAFIMAGFDGMKCGAKQIQSIKNIDKTIAELKNLKPDVAKFIQYKDLVDTKNLNGIIASKNLCNILNQLTNLSSIKIIYDLFCSEKFSIFSIVSLKNTLKDLKDKTQLRLDSIKHKIGEVMNSGSNTMSQFFFKSDFCGLIKMIDQLGIKEITNIVTDVESFICSFGSFKKYTNFITQTLEKGKNIEIKQDSFCKLIKQMMEIGLSDYYRPWVSALVGFYCNSGTNYITKIKKLFDEVKIKKEEIENEYNKLGTEIKEKLKTSIGAKELCKIIDAFKNINLNPDLATLFHIFEGVLCDKSDLLDSITKKKDQIIELIKTTVNQLKESSKVKLDSIASELSLDKKTIAFFLGEITKIVKIDESAIPIQFFKKWLKLPAPEIDSVFTSFFNLIGNFFQPLNENLKSAISDTTNAPETINKLKSLNEDLKSISEFKIDYKKIPSNLNENHIQSLSAFIQKLFDLLINPKDAEKNVQQVLSKMLFATSIQMKILDKNLKSVFDLLSAVENVKNSLMEELKRDIMQKLESQINAIKDFSEEKKQKLKDNLVTDLQNQLKDKLKELGNPKKLIENFKNKFKEMLTEELTTRINEAISGVNKTDNSSLIKIKTQINESLITQLKIKFSESGKIGVEKIKDSIVQELINDFSQKIIAIPELKDSSDDIKDKIKEDFKKEITEKLNEITKLYSENAAAAEGMKAKLKAELEKEMSDKLNENLKNISLTATDIKKIKDDLMAKEINSLKVEMIKQINSVLNDKIKSLKPEDLLDRVKKQFSDIKQFSEVLSVGEQLINLSNKITKLYASNDFNKLTESEGIVIKSKQDFENFLRNKKESIAQSFKKENEDLLKKMEEEKQKAMQLPNKDEVLKNLEAQREKAVGTVMKNYEDKLKVFSNIKENISKKNFCAFFENNNSFGSPSENIFNIIIREAFCDSVILSKLILLKDEIQNIKDAASKEKLSTEMILVPKKEILNLLNNHIEVSTGLSFQSLALMIVKEQFGGPTLIKTFIDTVNELEKEAKEKVNEAVKFKKEDICNFFKKREGFISTVLSTVICGAELPNNVKQKVDLFKKVLDMNSQHIQAIPSAEQIKGLLSKQQICDFYKVIVPSPQKGLNLPFILDHYLKKFLCGKGSDLNELKNEVKAAVQANLNDAAKNAKEKVEDLTQRVLSKRKLEKAYSTMGIINKTDLCKIVKTIKQLNLLDDDKKLIEKFLGTVFCDETLKFSDFGKSIDLENMVQNLVKSILEDVAANAAASAFPPALIYFAIKFVFVNFQYIYNISKYIISGDEKNEVEVKQLFNDLGSMIAKNLIP